MNDITAHEWSDKQFTAKMANEFDVLLRVWPDGSEGMLMAIINKSDVIALAKHFNLTTKDIEEK